jgi:hypothetical protein
MSARPEDACGFFDERLRRTEVMRSHPAGHQIEAGVLVGQGFGGVSAGFHFQTALAGGLVYPVEHGLGDVGANNLVSEAGAMQAGMTGIGGDIQHAGGRAQGNTLQRGRHIRYIGQDVALSVTMALPAELLGGGILDGIELHDFFAAMFFNNASAHALANSGAFTGQSISTTGTVFLR